MRSKIDVIAIVGRRKCSVLYARHRWRPVWCKSRWNLIGRPVFVAGLPSCRPRCVRCHRSRMEACGHKTAVDTRLLNRRLPLPIHGVSFCNRCPFFGTKGRNYLQPFLSIMCDSFRYRRYWKISNALLAIFGECNISARKFSLRRLSCCYYITPYCRQPLSLNLHVD